MQEPQHAVRLRQVGDDVAHRALLRRRQRVGQGGNDFCPQQPLGGAAATGALSHMAAEQRQRELAGEELVVGEPRPGRVCGSKVRGRRRMMDAAQRLGEGRERVALAPGFVLPLRQVRDAGERNLQRFAQLVRVQPLGQRIDRIDQRQLGKARGVDHPVRVHHLQMAVVECRDARHVAQLALGQELLQIIRRALK